MKYFKITMPKGHMGTGNSLDITFYIEATDGYSAMKKAQKMPMVKHTKFPTAMEEISRDEYVKNRRQSAYMNEKSFTQKGYKNS